MTVEIRSFREEDRPRLFELYEEAFGPEKRRLFERRWHWQFVEHPARELSASHIWVAEQRGVVVGHLASFPCRFQLGGEVVLLHHDCDLLVASEARRQGVGRRLVDAYDRLDNPISNALANYTSVNRRIRTRQGYRPIELMPSCVLPFSVRALTRLTLRSKRSWRRFETAPWSWAAHTLGWFGYVARGFHHRHRRGRSAFEIREVESSEGFDALWERARRDYDHVAVRDSAFAEWRFARDPNHAHTVLGAFAGGELRGYFVVCPAQEYGLQVGRVIDAFCALEDRACLTPLIDAALERLEALGVDYVRSIGLHPQLRHVVAGRLRHRPRRLDRPSWLRVDSSSEEDRFDPDALFDPARWHVSYADSDLAFS